MKSQSDVKLAFGTPFYKSEIELDKKVLNPALKQVKFTRVNTHDRDGSSSQTVLNEDFHFLHDPILEHVHKFVHDELGMHKRHDIYINHSWVMKHGREDSSGMHWHPNSIVSGVLYLQCDEDSGQILFHREKNMFANTLDFEFEPNMMNTQFFGHLPVDGDILIFPSTTYHSVDPSQSKYPRFCLAFNTWVRGELDPPFRRNSA